jgi:hypothetical protein
MGFKGNAATVQLLNGAGRLIPVSVQLDFARRFALATVVDTGREQGLRVGRG